MSLESDLHNFIETDSEISALIGGRVYPQVAPTGAATPYVVIDVVAGNPEYHAGGEAGVSTTEWDIDIFADTYAETISVKEKLRDQLSGKKGAVGSSNLRSVMVTEDRDLDQISEFGQQYTKFARRLGLTIAYAQTVSTPND